jgi:hypothetical protein
MPDERADEVEKVLGDQKPARRAPADGRVKTG